jgi:hypothetical protein
MKKNLTHIAIILDESRSMSTCKNDTIGGFNEFLNTQKKIKGEANVTLVKFSDYYKVINDGVEINSVAILNESNYTPSNNTALLDAVGKTINHIGDRLASMKEKNKPEKVIMVIITDGEENSSREFSKTKVAEMIKHQREKYSWEFLFIGADIDAWGSEIGITSNVSISKQNLYTGFSQMSHYTANYRVGNAVSTDSFSLSDAEISDDLQKMSKNNN